MLRRMRTIKNALKEIKALDTHTDIREWTIRCLVRDDKIDYVLIGSKVLLDFDSLLAYFNIKTA